MAERKRPGDDAAGGRPEDEAFDDAVADDEVLDDDVEADEPVTRGGGTAVRERTENADKPKSMKEGRRGGRIGGFFREVVSELRKVIWPTRKELLTYTAVVIVFVTVMTTIVAVLDYGFGKAILASFGN
ncbi:preprotein translocase subunit SecE [Actinoplanes sp. NPDC051475]|uniref:preprotein translocase subunit SecE n=1 Tax=Actinoplanes sp. NPDC051475 TaxID=3157225 RepID=UPI00344F3E16